VSATVLILSLAGLVGLVGPVPAARAAGALPLDPQQPLVPRIHSITPDYVPDRGPIVIRGTVTNASNQTWTAINVHGFMGSAPITSTDALSEAVKTPVNADVGSRIAEAGTFDSISSLVPGETSPFEVRLPHSTLPVSSPGVYWFGVHVLGDNGQGDARVAVGRDRTFIPYVPEGAIPAGGHEDAALVLPIRAGVIRGADGAVVDPEGWRHSLRSGALHSALATGEAARGRPLTWLVDPAVLDVARRLARGNPPRTLTTPRQSGNGGPSPSPGTPTASESGAAAASDTGATKATAHVARQWLKQARTLLGAGTGELLGLPYGDLAVESAARYGEPLLHEAFRRTGSTLRPWGFPLTPAISPPDGRTTSDAISRVPRDTDVLLPDTGVESADSAVSSAVNTMSGRTVLLTSSGAMDGGPGPAPPQSSLALRQRVLAEAALRVLDDQQPLVVELPSDMERPLRGSFFRGLDVPWLQLTTLSAATAVTPTHLDPSALREPSPDAPQFGERIYDAAGVTLTEGSTLQSVLTRNHVLRRQLFEEVAGNASYSASIMPLLALERMRGTAGWVHDNLDEIDLAAPQSVTLASNTGRFSAIVSNALDVPVTVNVHAIADPGLTITGGETLTLPPNGRTTVLLHASTHRRGVHNVTLQLTSRTGRPINTPGAKDQFPIRAEQVSRLIWVIIGAGVALLFAAIVVRLVRRVIGARAGRDAL
jgi:hypothetical protein